LKILDGRLRDFENRVEKFTDFTADKTKSESIRLEDIPEVEVHNYARWVLYGVAHNNKGVREYDRFHKEVHTFSDVGSDETLKETDLLVINENPEVSVLLVEKLKYLLRRLWLGSTHRNINLISLMIAHQRAIANYPDKQMRPGLILQFDVYKWSSWVPLQANSNKLPYVSDAIRWVTGEFDNSDLDYCAMLELISVCGKLNINLSYDNAKLYNEKFFDSFVVTYLPKNSSFEPITDARILTVSAFLDSPHISFESAVQDVVDFYTAYNTVYSTDLSIENQFTKDGFLYSSADELPLCLDVDLFSKTVMRTLVNINGFAYSYINNALVCIPLPTLTDCLKNGNRGEWVNVVF
jgi:hypothetical protein